jgi:twitching motility protein PilT
MLEKEISLHLSNPEISDLHIRVGDTPWVRTSGKLIRAGNTTVTLDALLDFLREREKETTVRVDTLEERLDVRGDLDFACGIDNFRIRGNLFWSSNRKLSLALRRLGEVPADTSPLGLPPQLMPLVNRSKGLLLVTGTTGSGKSTTLAALLEYMNQNFQRHIITIEDPIEYVFTSKKSLIQQRQIGREAPTFAKALRASLREDPDAIMIGELRDEETVETALHAANTGHLVLGTLHTVSSRQTIERIGMLFPEEVRESALQTLSSVLIGVLCQTLVPHAKDERRVLCYEMLLNTSQVRSAIKDNRINQIFSAMELGKRDGQVLLNNNLADKVRSGTISKDEALYYAYDPTGLEKELGFGR